jgi:hypothetical protein
MLEPEPMTRLARRKRWLLVGAVCVANFLVFGVVGSIMGGAAIVTNDGRYLLAQHGHFTEVSRELWIYSRVHMFSQAVTFPLAIFAAIKVRLGEDDSSSWSNRGRGAV